MFRRTLCTLLVVLVTVTAAAQDIVSAYEYWLDCDYAGRCKGGTSNDELSLSIDISGLSEGIHFLNFRAQDKDGLWGPIFRSLIFIAEPDASEEVASIKYWIDEPTDTLSINAHGTFVDFSLDISDLENGTHTFSCYLQNILGDTTEVYHFDFEVGYVETPVISRKNHTNTIVMETATEDAAIYYTLDGTTPTAESFLYEEPFDVTQNGIITAIAMKEYYFNSEVARLTVNWIAEEEDKAPLEEDFAYIGSQDTIINRGLTDIERHTEGGTPWQDSHRLRCDTLRAMLQCCSLDEPAMTQTYLKEVERIEEQLPGIHTLYSEIVAERTALQAMLDSLTTVENTLRLKLKEDVTKDEVSETGEQIAMLRQGYDTLTAKLAIVTVRDSDWVAQMEGVTQQVKSIESGIVEHTIGITAPSYALRSDQLARLHRYPKLRHLDLSAATMAEAILSDGCFSGLHKLITISLPTGVASYGSSLFADCPQLAAIVWNGSAIVTDRVLADIDNPNLLLYVGNASQVRDVSIRNIIVDGVAESIVLTDGDSPTQNTSFFAPQAFHVKGDISYTHTYTQQTVVGECQGWETIALPFDVQHIEHETNGEAVPFLRYEVPKRPFWLCRLTEEGFVDAEAIHAGVPYIISMPNSEPYSPYYRLNGSVRFSARGVTVPVTSPITDSRGEAAFKPSFGCVAASPNVFALNVGEEVDGHAEGSTFVNSLRDVRPFQAYRTTTAAGVKYMDISNDRLSGQDGIIMPQAEDDGAYYNLQGIRVATPHKGVYIHHGKKLLKNE